MAKQESIFPFIGKLGDSIGYLCDGEYRLRAMPVEVRQTVATRRSAQSFGVASKKGALIRKAFYKELDVSRDSGHVNRLNKMLIAAGDNHTAITGFRFNSCAGIDRFLRLAPALTDGILHIPPQRLAQYQHVIAVEVKVIAARIDFTIMQVSGTYASKLNIDPRGYFEGTNVPLDVPGGGTLIVTVQVRGIYKQGPSDNRQDLAAEIIAVVAP
jgi:hypothetical protein